MRVEFDPLHAMILAEAKKDGCIWIPYEVTEAENKKKKEEEEKNGGTQSKASVGITQKTMINIEDSKDENGEPKETTNYKKLLGDFV